MIWLIAFVTSLTFGIHTFVGGPVVVPPLLGNPPLPVASKWLAYYGGHIATVLLASMSLAFWWRAMLAPVEVIDPALVFFGGLSLALAGLSIAVARKGRINPLRFPSTTLFLIIAALCSRAVLH